MIIPVFDAESTLGEQLEALAAQTADLRWELVLSDNGSRDASAEIAEAFSERIENLRWVDASDSPGAAHARNRGARAARGSLLIFCDADDVADPGWVRAMCRALATSELVAGALRAEHINSEEALSWRHAVQSDAVEQSHHLPFVLSANLGCSARLFHQLGGFDESFVGAAGEDVDFSWRAAHAGVRPVFASDAVMHYRYRPTFAGALAQARAYGACAELLAARHPDAPPRTLRDDVFTYLAIVRRIASLMVVRRSVRGSAVYDLHFAVATTRVSARRRSYWRFPSDRIARRRRARRRVG